MDYQKHYNLLMRRARYRTLTGYTETHHVVPRCMGGKDVRLNKVELTAREHFVAHLLLVKLHPENIKLVYAVSRMLGGSPKNGFNRSRNRWYEWVRKRYSRLKTGSVLSKETRSKIARSNSKPHFSEAQLIANKRRSRLYKSGGMSEKQINGLLKGRTKEARVKAGKSISIAKKGVPQSESHKLALSLVRRGKVRRKESNQKTSVTLLAKQLTRSEYTRGLMREARLKTALRQHLEKLEFVSVG